MELFYNLAIAFGIPSAVTGFFFWLIKRELGKKEAKDETREQARIKHEILMIRGVNASLALGQATANAIKTHTCNGEMTKALDYASKVKHDTKDFLTEQGIQNLFNE